MALLKPRSILQLTIIGFLTMAVLLIAALVVTARQLDYLSYHSQKTVNETANAMRSSRALIEQTAAMERNARQFAVLEDLELLGVYADRRKEFIASANNLRNLGINDEVTKLSTTIIREEQKAYEKLKHVGANMDRSIQYPELLGLAYQASRAIDRWIDQQLLTMKQHAEHTQYLLKMQALMLVSIALLLAGLFTALITRPLRQIDRAIHQLGSGSYNKPVEIEGPLDLQELGSRLDWLRNRLGKLEQLRITFLRHVSHELKTPLAAIQEGVSLLNEGLVGTLNTQQNDVIKILHNNCRRLQQLIENLLRHNTESLAVINPMPQPVRLDKVVNHVISEHELALKTGQINIQQRLSKLTVHGGAEQIRVVIDNLITNAIKYSPQKGTIRVSLDNVQDNAVLYIRDEGPGIQPEEREQIFEAFYQGKAPQKKRFQGMGLGLAIANDYVKLNGGSIEIINSAKGAHFKVRFPMYEKES